MTAREAVMTAATPRDALLALADRIDALTAAPAATVDPWESWGPEPVSDGSVQTVRTEGRVEFVLPAPSEERREQRRLFEAQQLKLSVAIDSDTDWAAAYADGGPWWLYQCRRDIVMSLPYAARQAMVTDLEQDAPALAYEMALDILKQATEMPDLETASGALAVGNVG